MKKKWSNENIEKYIVENNYKLIKFLSENKGNTTKILVVCDKGHQYEVVFFSFYNGHRCLVCSGKLRKTHEQFCKEVYDLVGGEYSIQSEYVNARTKLQVKHNICNNMYMMTPNHILRGVKCPLCSHNKKKTTDDFIEDINNLENGDYELLSQYNGANKKVLIRHIVCNHEYWVKPNTFLRGSRCPKCANEKTIDRLKENTKTHELFCDELHQLVGDEYIALSKYKGSNNKVILKHTACECVFEVKPNNFIDNGTRCPKCSGLLKKNTELYKKEVLELTKNEYTVLGEYINSKIKILIKHNVCNHQWYISPNSFLRGTRCPVCAESKGENKILEFLQYNNIKFITQQKYEGLVGLGNGNLSYDFYLPNYNLLIEYQGEFHDGTAGNQTIEDFEKQQEHDKRKREYAIKNNIKLLEIWYWDFDNIEEILSKELNINK